MTTFILPGAFPHHEHVNEVRLVEGYSSRGGFVLQLKPQSGGLGWLTICGIESDGRLRLYGIGPGDAEHRGLKRSACGAGVIEIA